MEKMTRSQFIEKYGFDPHDPSSYLQTKILSGVVGDSINYVPGKLSKEEVDKILSSQKSVSFTTEQMQWLTGQSTKPVEFSQEQKDYIDSMGGPSAFIGTQFDTQKLTKQEFADKYGYDPRTRTSTQVQGAVGGSTKNQYIGSISPEDFAKLEKEEAVRIQFENFKYNYLVPVVSHIFVIIGITIFFYLVYRSFRYVVFNEKFFGIPHFAKDILRPQKKILKD